MKAQWPTPFTVPPTAPHTHTIILLHGRGGTGGEDFGQLLLFAAPTSSDLSLPAALPGVKWVFPTAKMGPSTLSRGWMMHQWFDISSLRNPEEKQNLQLEGISETSKFVGQLVQDEARALKGRADRVLVGGLSQGCAVGLHVLLNWKGLGKEALGGFIGMCGWLPFSGLLDPRRDCDEADGASLESIQLQAANTARDIASLPPLSGEQDDVPVFAQTPIFLGHGRLDDHVSIKPAERARDVLEALGCKVQWHDYDLGHSCKVPDEIDDVVNFLTECVGIGQNENE